MAGWLTAVESSRSLGPAGAMERRDHASDGKAGPARTARPRAPRAAAAAAAASRESLQQCAWPFAHQAAAGHRAPSCTQRRIPPPSHTRRAFQTGQQQVIAQNVAGAAKQLLGRGHRLGQLLCHAHSLTRGRGGAGQGRGRGRGPGAGVQWARGQFKNGGGAAPGQGRELRSGGRGSGCGSRAAAAAAASTANFDGTPPPAGTLRLPTCAPWPGNRNATLGL